MIRKNMLRYILPFHVDVKKTNKSNIFERLTESGWRQEHIIKGENDLYEYITDLVNESPGDDVASSWKLTKDAYQDMVFATKVEKQNIEWNIKQVGLVLFTTGVGLLWYEININNLESFADMQDFVYITKELARGKNEKNYLVTSEEKELKKICLYDEVLSKYISVLEIDSFFANRVKRNAIYPDRLIPFSWVYALDSEGKELDKAFHLGRGYKASYDMNSKINESVFFIPFNDSVWYTSMEGCANYIAPAYDKKFFACGYETRLNTYFYLYVLCLGQYYSLLQLAQEVSMLPTEESKYSIRGNRLEKLIDKIHVFNLKNNYSQVGHLTQHNDFYAYVQQKLGINKMQEELEVELQSLYEMIDRKKMIKREKNYQVLTIIGGIYVILQAFINVAVMYDKVVEKNWDYFFFAIAGMVILTVVGVIIWVLKRFYDK